MTLEEIKHAVTSGKTVCWRDTGYEVENSHEIAGEPQWESVYTKTGNSIGLTWSDGKTLNDEPQDFFVKE